MDIKGKKLVLVGGAGLIGSHTADHLIKEDVKEIIIYDNFVRGSKENLYNALQDPRVKIHDIGGDILQTEKTSFGISPDTYNWAVAGIDNREMIPQGLTRNFEHIVYTYHENTTEEDKLLFGCGNLGTIDRGFRNELDECCSTTPIASLPIHSLRYTISA